MALPIKPLPVIERWDCHQCGACCRGSIVPLAADDLSRLQAQQWEERPEFQGTPTIVRENWFGHRYRLAQREDGSCVFLMADGACRIHKDFGFEAKPFVCRMFPLQIVPRDNVTYVTLRRACPSAAADKGRTVGEHMEMARTLVLEKYRAEATPHPPAIKPGEFRGWRVARMLLQTFERLLTDERYPPVRRLVHALTVARLVEAARTKSLTDEQLYDLFAVLERSAPDETGDLFSSRPAPSHSGAVIFRQMAAEFVRLHPRFQARPSWGERWQLMWAAWRFVRGRGKVPRLHPLYPEATFEQLEQPLGTLGVAIMNPLARMFETTAVSGSYALANRGAWSIIESLRMLAVLYPIGLWMLRWISADRTPQVADMPEIIATLDRGQGFAPLAGYKQRRRIQILAQLGDLERLVVWYGR
jgi:lysine-N-methylase